jgi:hypothetical protein
MKKSDLLPIALPVLQGGGLQLQKVAAAAATFDNSGRRYWV